MNRLGWIALGLAWGVLVFLMVFLWTFPGDVAADRLEVEVARVTNDRVVLDVAEAHPWWTGLQAEQVIVSRRDPKDPGAAPEPMFFADAVGLRAGLFSLLRYQPDVTGYLQLGDGQLDIWARTDARKRPVVVHALEAEGDDLPAEDLLSLALRGTGAEVVASGGVDVEVDLTLGEGPSEAKGEINLKSGEIDISELILPMFGADPLSTLVEELDLRLRIDEGVAEISRGVLRSTMADLEVGGTVELSDRLAASRAELTVEMRLHDWTGTPLESFRSLVEGFLRAAAWSDGTYHYEAKGALRTMGTSSFRPVREPSSRSSTGATRTPPGGFARPQRERVKAPMPLPELEAPEVDADAEQAREDARERARDRELDRELGRERDPDDPYDDDEYLDDEEFEDELPPLEDEELPPLEDEDGRDEELDELGY